MGRERVIVAVVDAGPLIHLAEIGALELFSTLDELLIPATVYEELRTGGLPSGLTDLSHEVVEPSTGSPRPADDLDAGEAAALVVAAERDAVLLTDDLDARSAAKERGIEVHGSVGLIALAYGRGELDRSSAADLMRALQDETSLFVTDSVIERGIALLDEDG